MKITIAAAAALAMAATAQGKSEDKRQVAVYLSNSIIVPIVVRARAEFLASRIFAEIGVTLKFRKITPALSDADVITVEFVDSTPAGLLSGAWAYALPYEGVHIRIFWDRVQYENSPSELLAHVMVHEITHILEGNNQHSTGGIMNTRWTNQERSTLDRKPLQFTQQDVEMIYRGMESRDALAAKLIAEGGVAQEADLAHKGIDARVPRHLWARPATSNFAPQPATLQ
jgi:hypothetical protein